MGRLDPTPARARYRLAEQIRFVPLPHYGSLSEIGPAVRGLAKSLAQLWKACGDADCLWLLGPHPLAVAGAVMALFRRRKVVLGVRQDLPRYVASRHPRRRLLRLSALLLESIYRGLARVTPVIVVGPDLAERYRHSPDLLETTISVVRESEVVSPAEASKRNYEGELTLLSVGRLDAEKNPLMLAEVLDELRRDDPRWRLLAYGEGPLREPLREKLDRLGLISFARLPGYVALDQGLLDAYRSSHVYLNVSWTEGVPQTVMEALAAALPAVATDVGGTREALGDAVRIVPPGDPDAAAEAVAALVRDPNERGAIVERGHRLVKGLTLDAASGQVGSFLRAHG